MFYGTSRKPTGIKDLDRVFGSERHERLQLGRASVTIPKDHRVGELEIPKWWKLEFREDPRKHVVLQSVTEESADKFYSELRTTVQGSSTKGLLLFVHGFNVAFEDAIKRTAQIAYDVQFNGAPVLYSWPSQGRLSPLAYTADEEAARWAVGGLKEFLTNLATSSGARRIHLLAHSMGNRVLTDAIRELRATLPKERIQNIVLTAPDIDVSVLVRDIAPALTSTSRRVTLYASANDEALAFSRQVHNIPRAGDGGESLVVQQGIDTIDVSLVDTTLIGHSYYGENRSVISDLFNLLRGRSPNERCCLLVKSKQGLPYWQFTP